ncbi:MAG: hypothetical protein HY660_13825 [Armatimonadetes bacterium]|nr:hypothetical protein [Armatimonadota bacterium]
MHRVHRLMMLVSIGQNKVKAFLDRKDRKGLEKQAVELAKALRGQPGVRTTDVFLFKFWWTDSKTIAGWKSTTRPPWTPYGALVCLEARDDDTLQKYAANIWKVATEFDQEGMGAEGVDSW